MHEGGALGPLSPVRVAEYARRGKRHSSTFDLNLHFKDEDAPVQEFGLIGAVVLPTSKKKKKNTSTSLYIGNFIYYYAAQLPLYVMPG